MAAHDDTAGAPRAGGADRSGFAHRKLLGILSGSWLAQACYAVVRLGVPDLLGDGPSTVEDLAAVSGADPGVLHRILRALAAAGVFRHLEPRVFAHNQVSELLRSDAPGSAHLIALMQGDEVFRSFAEIMHTVRTGQPSFAKVYGMSFYDYLDANPDAARAFNEPMGGQGPVPSLSTCDFSDIEVVVDVGGGNGTLLGEVLAGNPGVRGVLLERPDAISRARSKLTELGLDDRVTYVEGDFFSSVPTGGDVYVLARILHNWTDEHCIELLRRVHSAMAPGTRLLVMEEMLPEDGSAGASAVTPGLVDLLMLVTVEGHDRTAGEYCDLLVKAGFAVVDTRRAAASPSSGVIEAVPA